MKKRFLAAVSLVMCSVLMLSGCGASNLSKGKSEMDIKKGIYECAIGCHDPQIILAEDGKYYMTGSHQILAVSEDLDKWDYIAKGNNMFSNIFSGDLPAFAFVGKNEEGGYSVWASNIFYNEVMKKYVMYFCTTSTYIKSNLCMAVSDKPEGPYEYTDTFLYSGFTKSEIDKTNLYEVVGVDADISRYLKLGGYDNSKWPNCIDPAVFTDTEDRMWMVYGSWSGGIFLLELDPSTGLPIHPEEGENVDPYFGYKLAGGGHHPVEGPFIIYSPESGYYHLFVSYGELKANGGYQVRQFRSKNPTGPYEDVKGQVLSDEEDYMSYGLKMMGNYSLPSLSDTYMAPGGQSVFVGADGSYYLSYHQRFASRGEYFEPRIHKLFLNEDGWFTASVFETIGEDISESGYEMSDISGKFYILDHGLDVSDQVPKYEECEFKNGAFESENFSGTYDVNESHITLMTDDVTYRGEIIEMTDEAGNEVLTISTVGDNNRTIWAVQYK